MSSGLVGPSGKVELRSEIDSTVAFQHRNDARIYRWCRQSSPLSWPEHCTWIQTLPVRKDVRMFSIVRRKVVEDGQEVMGVELKEQVGVCGFTSIDQLNQRAEFSLYIGPEYQGKGYGLDALVALLKHGFKDLNLHRIWGETFDGNPATKCFKYAGMTYEGTFRQSYFKWGEWIDSHIYAVLRKDFEEKWKSYY